MPASKCDISQQPIGMQSHLWRRGGTVICFGRECNKEVSYTVVSVWHTPSPPWTCPLQGRALLLFFFLHSWSPSHSITRWGKVESRRFIWTFRGHSLQAEGQHSELTVSQCSRAPPTGPNCTLQQVDNNQSVIKHVKNVFYIRDYKSHACPQSEEVSINNSIQRPPDTQTESGKMVVNKRGI